MFIFNLLLFLIALSALIFIHELGHFLFAKLFGVYCMEFSLGMGPAVFSKKFKFDNETKYSLRYLPIGGYVAMAGEIDGDEQEKELNIPCDRTINGVKSWKRAIITIAGVSFNLIFALIFTCIYVFGYGIKSNDNRITIDESSIAYNAGIRTGDRIISVTSNIITEKGEEKYTACIETNCSINTISELVAIINQKAPSSTDQIQEIKLSYYQNNELKSATITRTLDTNTNNPEILGLSEFYKTPSFSEGIKETFSQFGYMISEMFKAFGMLFSKNGLDIVGGPIQVYTASVEVASHGFFFYMFFMAFLSVNLAFFNLLPIPGLDGARFLLSVGETITNKKFNTKIESYINLAGMFLLFGLMIVITIKDIFMLF